VHKSCMRRDSHADGGSGQWTIDDGNLE